MWDTKQIDALRIAYNKEHPKETPIPKGSSESVWTTLKSRLHDACQTEACIVTSLIQKPSAPMDWATNPTSWLSSDDIERVQKNYTKLLPNYYFTGCVPIDFNSRSKTGVCLVDALCSLDIRKLYKRGKTMIGIVFNTDPHDAPGEHWIAAFCDIRPELDEPYMTYFDSYAQHPEPQVIELMNAWKAQWDSTQMHSKPMKLYFNKIRHQYKTTECGMYCIYFLHCSLFGIPMESRIPDEVMVMMRRFFFEIPPQRRRHP